MVTAEIDDQSRTGRIILTPNQSWSWKYNLYLLYTLAAVSIVFSIGFLMAGAWLIIPFSILELLVLFAAMYYCVLQCRKLEVITVSEHDVCVEKGVNGPTERWDFHKLWAQYTVQPARDPWDPQVVSIRSHGRELELGSFLNRKDKSELIRQLRRVVPN